LENVRNAGLLQIYLESFIHAGAANETKVNVVSIHSEYITVANVKKNYKV
jgi:CTP synthase